MRAERRGGLPILGVALGDRTSMMFMMPIAAGAKRWNLITAAPRQRAAKVIERKLLDNESLVNT